MPKNIFPHPRRPAKKKQTNSGATTPGGNSDIYLSIPLGEGVIFKTNLSVPLVKTTLRIIRPSTRTNGASDTSGATGRTLLSPGIAGLVHVQ